MNTDKRNRRMASLFLAAALLLPAAGALGNGHEASGEWDWASGLLYAGRNDTLSCIGVNKGDSPATLFVSLVNPGGTEIDHVECAGLAPNGVCTVSVKNPSPIPIVAHCNVNGPFGGAVSGGARHDNPNGVTQTTSDLQPVMGTNGTYVGSCDEWEDSGGSCCEPSCS